MSLNSSNAISHISSIAQTQPLFTNRILNRQRHHRNSETLKLIRNRDADCYWKVESEWVVFLGVTRRNDLAREAFLSAAWNGVPLSVTHSGLRHLSPGNRAKSLSFVWTSA